jgi:hypothetical protein
MGEEQRPYPDGTIRYFNLQNWWMSEFSESERAYIESVFKPLGGINSLTDGHIHSTTDEAHYMLRALAGWFYKTDADIEIANRILAKHDEILKGI